MRELHVVIHDVHAGVLRQDGGGRLSFSYDDDYIAAGPDALPLCLALPLGQRRHTGVRLRAYLQGLLPDNQTTLEAWGRRFGVSGANRPAPSRGTRGGRRRPLPHT